MIDRDAALAIAARNAPSGTALAPGSARELQSGWLFLMKKTTFGGPRGLVVNKNTGRVFALASSAGIDRQVELYERGYQFERFDLVITAVHAPEAALAMLARLGLSVVEPTYENGTVWRVPRPMTAQELQDRLVRLPAIVGDLATHFHAEHIERARADGVIDIVVIERAT